MRLAVLEAEVLDDEVALALVRPGGATGFGLGEGRRGGEHKERGGHDTDDHFGVLPRFGRQLSTSVEDQQGYAVFQVARKRRSRAASTFAGLASRHESAGRCAGIFPRTTPSPHGDCDEIPSTGRRRFGPDSDAHWRCTAGRCTGRRSTARPSAAGSRRRADASAERRAELRAGPNDRLARAGRRVHCAAERARPDRLRSRSPVCQLLQVAAQSEAGVSDRRPHQPDPPAVDAGALAACK